MQIPRIKTKELMCKLFEKFHYSSVSVEQMYFEEVVSDVKIIIDFIFIFFGKT